MKPRGSLVLTSVFWLGVTFAVAWAEDVTSPSLQSGVALFVRESAGLERVAEPATFGVPIAEYDSIYSTQELAVVDADGKPLLAQFRVLQRWGGAPSDETLPIRWVLIDLQITVPANTLASLTLTKAANVLKPQKGKKSKGPRLDLKAKKADYTIDTKGARFVLSREKASFLEAIRADINHDGKLSSNENVLDGFEAPGFVLTDRQGVQYTTAGNDFAMTVEETGPLRTVIRVDGRHAPVTVDDVPAGIGRDFFRFTTRYTFYAGKAYVRVQHSLQNDYLDAPLGAMGFESYTLPLKLRSATKGSASSPTFRGGFGLGDGTTFSQPGPLRLYQDSDGGTNWAAAPNTTFQGFRVLDSADPTNSNAAIVASGAQAAGYAVAGDEHRGIVVVMRDFFENFPKGFSFDGDRTLNFDIFPSETASFFWLDDAQQKTTEFLIAPYAADDKHPFDPAVLARDFDHPLHPFIDPEYMRRSKAWGDQGDLDDPPQDDLALIAYDVTKQNDMYTQAFARSNFAFGWSDFGEYYWAKSTHTTGSPRNKLTYFDRFAINGSEAGFRVNELFAMHSRDLRTYHIRGFDKDQHPQANLWEGIPSPVSVDKLGRDQIPAGLAANKAGIPSSGHGWNGFDIEHLVADDLYEYYLLTGDPVSYDALVSMGQAMRTWPVYTIGHPVGSSRGIGWFLRAVLRIYRVTGDPRILDIANQLVAVVDSTYNKSTPSPVTGDVYHWVTRFPPNASHIADAEYDVPWQLAIVIHGMLMHHRDTGSTVSRQIALDVADYLVDFCWDPVKGTIHESLAVDDPSDHLPKPDNTGVNTWIPSAFAVAYRQYPRVEYLGYAQIMYNSIPNLQSWNTYYGWGLYHWWHDYRALILGY